MHRARSIVIAFVVLLAAGAATFGSEPLTVMSFNIRYGTAPDGENHWLKRREFLFDVVREQDADVIGLQEALDAQITELVAAVPAYAVIGVGRDDAKRAGEYSAILVRKDRFRVADAGTFWFSDTPAVVASATWSNRIPRICTWARLIDRDGSAFWVFNVHLDHQSQPSREKSTELLAKRVAERAYATEPVVITGDFNAGEDNPAIKRLVAAGAAPAPFIDTFRVLHPDAKDVGTFSGFAVDRIGGPKIDYVLVLPGTTVINAAIIRTARHGRTPSDHFPVVARVRLP